MSPAAAEKAEIRAAAHMLEAHQLTALAEQIRQAKLLRSHAYETLRDQRLQELIRLDLPTISQHCAVTGLATLADIARNSPSERNRIRAAEIAGELHLRLLEFLRDQPPQLGSSDQQPRVLTDEEAKEVLRAMRRRQLVEAQEQGR